MESTKITRRSYEKFDIDSEGNKFWYDLNRQLHRTDGPAIEYNNGDKAWYFNGSLHREDGPAIEWLNGYKEWWLNGERHRIDGPVMEYSSGYRSWWVKGKLHRIDGPAIEREDNHKEWYINDIKYSEEEFNEAVGFPDIAIPYITLRNGIYFIKSRGNVGIRIEHFAEAYLNGNFIRLNEEIKELLLQFARGSERLEPLLDWIQENSSYFSSEFIEKLFFSIFE